MDMMRSIPEKERSGITGSVIDYTYANYDPQDAATEYDAVDRRICELQLALDKVNITKTFEV
jgi:hypothetical protein